MWHGSPRKFVAYLKRNGELPVFVNDDLCLGILSLQLVVVLLQLGQNVLGLLLATPLFDSKTEQVLDLKDDVLRLLVDCKKYLVMKTHKPSVASLLKYLEKCRRHRPSPGRRRKPPIRRPRRR